MNNNIILLEKLYENMNNAYIEKEKAHSAWDYDNEYLNRMDRSCNSGYNMDLFDKYIQEKMNYDIHYNLYNEKHKTIINYIKVELPIDCINYLKEFI